VRTPEEALRQARQRAAEARAGGGPGAAAAGGAAATGAELAAQANRQLARWAIVEPDRAQVYSTRRLGAPITALKHLLIRLLRQYLDQVTAQQSRFNAHAAAYMLSLEDRIRVLEEQLAQRDAAEHEADRRR
jgi:hypothetical protein